jgi:aminoglycoside/choline kinase family phosphotransferase
MNRVSASAGDVRLQLLGEWLRRDVQLAPDRIEPASVDASFRRYFRVWRGRETFIAMDAPPAQLSIAPYVELAGKLLRMGVTVPRIFARDDANGFLLASDLGKRMYLDELTEQREDASRVDALYREALVALCAIQSRGGGDTTDLPIYDRAFLLREMNLMPEWFCAKHLRLSLSGAEEKLLAECFELLAAAALEQPQVFVHRDYHSRNLMVLAPDTGCTNPGILDFQDAVQGPVTYDPVSLLKDCYIAWPRERVLGWLRSYRQMADAARVPVGDSEETYVRWFDLLGAQRHLKVLGIFARLCHRDGKPGYLRDLPRVLDYVTAVCGDYGRRHAELAALGDFLARRVQPVLAERNKEAVR